MALPICSLEPASASHCSTYQAIIDSHASSQSSEFLSILQELENLANASESTDSQPNPKESISHLQALQSHLEEQYDEVSTTLSAETSEQYGELSERVTSLIGKLVRRNMGRR